MGLRAWGFSDHEAERSGEEVKGPAGLAGSASPSRRGGMPFVFFCFFVRSKASVRFLHVALDSWDMQSLPGFRTLDYLILLLSLS